MIRRPVQYLVEGLCDRASDVASHDHRARGVQRLQEAAKESSFARLLNIGSEILHEPCRSNLKAVGVSSCARVLLQEMKLPDDNPNLDYAARRSLKAPPPCRLSALRTARTKPGGYRSGFAEVWVRSRGGGSIKKPTGRTPSNSARKLRCETSLPPSKAAMATSARDFQCAPLVRVPHDDAHGAAYVQEARERSPAHLCPVAPVTTYMCIS